MTIVQYVDIGQTIADIAVTEKSSASLTATTSILLSVLLVASFALNVLLIATVLSSYKLRQQLLYLMFCQLAAVNVVDAVFIMFVALLYVSNGNWTFGDGVCRLNAWAQQFAFLHAFFTIMLLSMERALGLTQSGRSLVRLRYAVIFSLLFAAVSFSFAAPAFFNGFPVRPYPYRYLCAVGGGSPVIYSAVELVAYGGGIFVMTICFGAVYRYNRRVDRALPARPQDYGSFIMESRALQDYMAHGRLVLFLALAFAIIQGPYIVLSFFVQIRNSEELLRTQNMMEIAQDVDTLITWLKLFFPLVTSILIYTVCPDIWTKLLNLIWCRRSDGVGYGSMSGMGSHGKNGGSMYPNNVITLVATTEGLQMRGADGQYIRPPPVQSAYMPRVIGGGLVEREETLDYPLPNQLPDAHLPYDESLDEVRTHSVASPRILRPPRKRWAARTPLPRKSDLSSRRTAVPIYATRGGPQKTSPRTRIPQRRRKRWGDPTPAKRTPRGGAPKPRKEKTPKKAAKNEKI